MTATNLSAFQALAAVSKQKVCRKQISAIFQNIRQHSTLTRVRTQTTAVQKLCTGPNLCINEAKRDSSGNSPALTQ